MLHTLNVNKTILWHFKIETIALFLLIMLNWDVISLQIFTPKVAVMYLICVVAFFFYFTRFPEVCCPGKLRLLIVSLLQLAGC